MTARKVRRIAWFVQARRLDVASIRYRCYHLAAALDAHGFRSRAFDKTQELIPALKGFDVVVIVKRIDTSVLDVAAAARDYRIPVLMDFCDDILAEEYRAHALDLNRAVFRALAPMLSAVVTTGPGMSQRLRSYGVELPTIVEAPDVAENREVLAATTAYAAAMGVAPAAPAPAQTAPTRAEIWRGRAARALRDPRAAAVRARDLLSERLREFERSQPAVRLRAAARRGLNTVLDIVQPPPPPPPTTTPPTQSADKRPRVVWFGNHGAPHSTFGMLTLLQLAGDLRAAATLQPFVLEIVSNHRDKFDAFVAQMGLPCVYTPWTLESVYAAMDRSAVALVTGGDDSFCDVKSANRALQALACGRPVVATPYPALAPLSGAVWTGNVGEGLVAYLKDKKLRAAHVAAGKEIVAREFSLPAVGAVYADALQAAIDRVRSEPSGFRLGQDRPRLLFLLDLAQDLRVVEPLLIEARARDVETCVIATAHAGRKTPGIVPFLSSARLIPTVASLAELESGDARWLRGANAVVMAAESSLPSHRVAHAMARLARRFGVLSVTLQHGLETPGLTYRDRSGPVDFASDIIVSWTDPAALPDWVDPAVRSRCLGLGRAWRPGPAHAAADAHAPVGVFENLHWDRYSKAYRTAFVDDLLAAAQAVPEREFVVHSHPAGLWFCKHGPQALPANIGVAGPAEDGLAAIKAAGCVVTTPSTVALDAAASGRPVAVAHYDLTDLATYAPLPSLREVDDWTHFIAAPDAAALESFRARVCRTGDASAAILDAILARSASAPG